MNMNINSILNELLQYNHRQEVNLGQECTSDKIIRIFELFSTQKFG